MSRRLTGCCAVGLLLGGAAACPRAPGYACGGDEDCDRAGASGWCLADGACAYPSDACESGWVRSPNALERPGQCETLPGGSSSGSTSGSADSAGVATTSSTTTEGSSSDSSTGLLAETSESGELPTCGSLVRLTVDTTFLSASEVLEGYPLAIVLDDPALVSAIEAGGGSPVVTDDAGVVLAQELERLDAAAGTLAVWVRLPAYALGDLLPLQLRWGGLEGPGDPAEVWVDRYAGVWHMGDPLSGVDGDEIGNSVALLEPGLTGGEMAPAQSVAGVIGRALVFDGLDDVVTVDAEFVGQLESYSITMWVRFDGAANDPGSYFQRLNGESLLPRCWRQPSADVFCQYGFGAGTLGLVTGVLQAPGQLIHLAMVRDAAAATSRVYVDGELLDENTDPPGAVLASGSHPFEIGHGHLGTLPGMIDEVRVSEAALPESWVRADYRTQLQPGLALESVGSIEATPCPE